MERSVAIAIMLLLLSPIATASPYLQAGGGAARTGLTADPGPATSDVVFIQKLPGAGAIGQPLLMQRHAYVLTAAQNALVSVGLDDAAMRTLATFDGTPEGMASDGSLLYVVTALDVEAIRPTGGDPVWKTPLPLPVPGGSVTSCAAPAIALGSLYALCVEGAIVHGTSLQGSGRPFAVALDLATGTLQHTFDASSPTTDPDTIDSGAQGSLVTYVPMSLSVLSDRIILGVNAIGKYTRDAQIWALDPSFTLQWHKSARTLVKDNLDAGADKFYGPSEAAQQSIPVFLTGDSRSVYYVAGRNILVYDPETGASRQALYLSDAFVPGQDQPSDEYDNGALATNVALTATSLLIQEANEAYTVDRKTEAISTRVLPGNLHYACACAMLVSGGKVYGIIERGTATNEEIVPGDNVAEVQNYAMATTMDGDEIWRAKLPPFTASVSGESSAAHSIEFSLGEGVLALSQVGGELVILGVTPASMVAHASVADAFPAVGADASVDLSASAPGALGPATSYRAEWGDGDATEDQPSPVLHHAYQLPGDHLANVTAINEHGQTSTTSVVFHVGASPPIRPTLLTRALDPANQNITFGLIGLAATGTGGLIALFARRRKRSVLARELKALDDAREKTRGDPLAWRASVAERRTHHATLLKRRRIDSGELLVLERRIEVLSGAATTATPAAAIGVGSRLMDRYRIDRMLGEGGQGRVYLARDETIGRDVVVKAVPIAGLGGQAKRLLFAEARLAGGLDHPNVVRVLDVVDGGAEAYLVLEYVDGGSLRQRLARGPLPRRDALRIAREVLAGLDAAHARGIVHGDIKPENVLLTRDGVAKLADFGTAHEAGREATMAQTRMGTLRYMSPEQVRGRASDARSDTYAACALLAEMLTGEPVHAGALDDFQLRAKILDGVRELTVPADLAPTILRGLALDPADRYQSARDLLAALERAA